MPLTTPDLLPPQEIFKDEKPGIRYYKLLKLLPEIPKGISKRPYIDEIDRVLNQLYTFQSNAKILVHQGKLDSGFSLYEHLVDAQFDDPTAYLRLCNYYAKKGNPEKVSHICNCYCQMADSVSALGYKNRYRDEIVEVFLEILAGIDRYDE